MTKSPVLSSFAISVALSIAILVLWIAMTPNVAERGYVMGAVLLLFPVLWFVTWLIVNAIVWWREMAGGGDAADAADVRAKTPSEQREPHDP